MPVTMPWVISVDTRSRISEPGHTVKHLFFILLIAVPGFSSAQEVPGNLENFSGTYTGDVFNGDDLDPITTVFRVVGDNRLTGNYSVSAEQFTYEGTISNIVFEDDRTFSGEWTDRFGEGFLRLQFSRDFSSFTGFWADYDTDNQLPWNGKRQ